jgi:hypothetical protein
VEFRGVPPLFNPNVAGLGQVWYNHIRKRKSKDYLLRACSPKVILWRLADRVSLETALPPVFGKESLFCFCNRMPSFSLTLSLYISRTLPCGDSFALLQAENFAPDFQLSKTVKEEHIFECK